MATAKLTRSASSLSRSPSIKLSMNSLSGLDEVLTCKNSNRIDQTPYQEETKKPQFSKKRSNLRFLLPPLVIIVFPCVYFYVRCLRCGMTQLHDNSQAVTGLWFDYVFMVFFFSAVLVSVKVAYPQLNLVHRLRSSLSCNWGCLILACLKPLNTLLCDARDKNKSHGVTWTIGSKPKFERMKSVREGVQNYSNGDVYEGEFHQGRFSGSGVYFFYLSGKYEGDWVDGKFDGYGVETWARGSCYRGQYRCGLREGYGVYRFYTGDVYSGEWSKGQSHGCGVQTCVDGSRYVGGFKWGVKHGFGYYHFRNGDTYAGEYFADKMHGYGVYQFANGHRYEGAWHEGKRQGLGMYEFRNGDRQGGHWQSGSWQTQSSHSVLPGAPLAVSHSKVLHAVQEARRASAKALQGPHVDVRVNKAVAAANEAANAGRVAAERAVQSRLKSTVPSVEV